MGNRQDTAFIVGVFAEVVGRKTSDETRLSYGSRLRQEVQKAIQEGKVLDHYRYKWLNDSANDIIDFLQDIAKGFDTDHPNDMCSAQDLLDILAVAHSRLKRGFEKKASRDQTTPQEPNPEEVE
jgi:hypothetical protein